MKIGVLDDELWIFTNQPIAMNDYKTVKIYEYTQGCFNLLDELRDFMDAGAVEIGYIAPSHGSKSNESYEEPPDKIQCTECSEHNNTLE